ncbi:hypothetical protein NQD34_003509 [Periophthalmus magnuspinnatus]|nr:hypothetical protein NQD34_003509 [Periophthalmus magnuspinnatus]
MAFTRSAPQYRAASIYGGAGGKGTRVSSASSLRSGAPMISATSSYKVSSGMGAGLGAGMGAGMGAGRSRFWTNCDCGCDIVKAVLFAVFYFIYVLLSNCRFRLNSSLYFFFQIFDRITENARIVLQIDNARLAADDFKVKFDNETTIRQSVEADIAGLKKLIDETNMSRMNIESEIEAVKEELAFLKKNHENEVMELRNQISQSGVQVDVDAPKGQDLSQIMEEVRANYEKMAQKNTADLKRWHENQIADVQVQVSQNTEALQGAQMEKSDLTRQIQTLEIELASQQSLKASLEDTLRNVEMRTNMEMEKYNIILMRLEEELTQLRANIQQQSQEYQALLNIKVKLEAEIAMYKNLLDGGDFKLQDALEELAASS